MIELIPAYGRKYKNMGEALKDWDDEKDFKVFNGPYCSKRDLDTLIKDWGKVVLVNNEIRHVLGKDIWGNLI